MTFYTMTKDEVKKVQEETLVKLIRVAGSRKHLALMLGVEKHLIDGWCRSGRISKNGFELVTSHPTLKSKIDIKNLRPELYI